MALATITLEVEHRFPDLEKRHRVLTEKKHIQKLTFSSLFLFQIPYLGSEIKYDNIYQFPLKIFESHLIGFLVASNHITITVQQKVILTKFNPNSFF